MSFLSRDWLLEHNKYGNTAPITYRTYAEDLIKSAPIYNSFDEETNNQLLEIEQLIYDMNIREIVSHIEDGTLKSWLINWRGEVLNRIECIKRVIE